MILIWPSPSNTISHLWRERRCVIEITNKTTDTLRLRLAIQCYAGDLLWCMKTNRRDRLDHEELLAKSLKERLIERRWIQNIILYDYFRSWEKYRLRNYDAAVEFKKILDGFMIEGFVVEIKDIE